MKYRMYCPQIKFEFSLSIFALALCLSGCASGPKTSADHSKAMQTDDDGHENKKSGRKEIEVTRFDGREPSSMKGEFTWLNDVEDDFGRIAAETSSRAVASQNKHEVLIKQKVWTFSYLPKTNHFYVDLQGTQYQMVQTKIDDGERFAFAAEGQAENPLTFAVTKGEGRNVASGETCTAEISYWSKSAKSYVTERRSLQGKSCTRMMSRLKEYVP